MYAANDNQEDGDVEARGVAAVLAFNSRFGHPEDGIEEAARTAWRAMTNTLRQRLLAWHKGQGRGLQ